MQSSSQIVTTNPQLFTGRMSFLSPNQQCQSTEQKPSKMWLGRKPEGGQTGLLGQSEIIVMRCSHWPTTCRPTDRTDKIFVGSTQKAFPKHSAASPRFSVWNLKKNDQRRMKETKLWGSLANYKRHWRQGRLWLVVGRVTGSTLADFISNLSKMLNKFLAYI